VAKTVERGLQYRLEIAGVAVNLGDGDDHVEDLFQREVVADFASALRGDKQWFGRTRARGRGSR
jgi:hypothetical protein